MSVQMPANPYVGPRPFTSEEADLFFGRDHEANQILSLVIAKRLVLFYAESGAGKSSLVNARLLPELRKRNFIDLPVGRVSGKSNRSTGAQNVFTHNLLLSLEMGKEEPRPNMDRLTLKEYLAGLALVEPAATEIPRPIDSPPVIEGVNPLILVIDQFEELFTDDPGAWDQREPFFSQLCEAMEFDPFLWVVLVIREDYVAALDAYAYLLPGGLRARYYMQSMGKHAALEAMMRPAQQYRRPFTPDAAEMLVQNLRQVPRPKSTSEQGITEYVEGEFIEPVQLQVVCYQLWNQVQDHPGDTITVENLEHLASSGGLQQFVDRALANFYEQAIKKVIDEMAKREPLKTRRNELFTERRLREWFSQEMITEVGTRNIVFQIDNWTGNLPNSAIGLLAKQFIIRPEKRAETMWFELSHDRFIGPIRESNRVWFETHRNRILADAEAWRDANKTYKKLYEGKQLEEALENANKPGEELGPLEREFLEKSQLAAQRRQTRRQRIGLLLLSVALVLTMVLVVLAVSQSIRATASEEIALQQKGTAESLKMVADANREIAVQQAVTAEAASVQEAQQRQIAETASVQEYQQRQTAEAASALAEEQKKVAEEQRSLAEEQRKVAEQQSNLAQAGELSSLSDYYRDRRLDLSLLLAVEAFSRSDTWETRKAMLEGIQRSVATRASVENQAYPICEDPEVVTFSPDGKMLATACFDGRVGLYYTQGAGKVKPVPAGYLSDTPVKALAFNADSTILAWGDNDGNVFMWNIQTDAVNKFRPSAYTFEPIRALGYQPEGTLLAIATERDFSTRDGRIVLYDEKLGKELLRRTCGPYNCITLAWSQDGRRLAVGNDMGSIFVLDAKNGIEIRSLSRVHADDVTGLAWYPDGKRLVSGGMDGFLYQWDVDTGEKLQESSSRDTPLITGLALSSNGRALMTGTDTNSGPPWVAFWNGETLERFVSSPPGHSQAITSVAADPSGQRFATTSNDNTFILWNYEPVDSLSKVVWDLRSGPIVTLGLGQNNFLLLARRVGEVGLENWTERTEKPAYFDRFGEPIHSVVLLDQGKTVVIDGSGGMIRFIDPQTGQETGKPAKVIDSGVVRSIAVTPDSSQIAVIACRAYNEDCDTVIAYDRTVGAKIDINIPIAQMPGEFTALAFSDNGQTLALADRNGEILFYDMTARQLEKVTAGLTNLTDSQLRITRLAFSPADVGLVAAGYSDGRIALWETATKNPVGEFNDLKESSITGLLFRQNIDGFWVMISANEQGKVVEWQVDRRIWQARACSMAGRVLTGDEKERFLFERNAIDACTNIK